MDESSTLCEDPNKIVSFEEVNDDSKNFCSLSVNDTSTNVNTDSDVITKKTKKRKFLEDGFDPNEITGSEPSKTMKLTMNDILNDKKSDSQVKSSSKKAEDSVVNMKTGDWNTAKKTGVSDSNRKAPLHTVKKETGGNKNEKVTSAVANSAEPHSHSTKNGKISSSTSSSKKGVTVQTDSYNQSVARKNEKRNSVRRDSSDGSDTGKEELNNAKKEKGRSVNKASSSASGTGKEELHNAKKEKGLSVNKASSGASGTGKEELTNTKKEKGRGVNKASSAVSGAGKEELHNAKKEKGRSVNKASSGASGTGKEELTNTKKKKDRSVNMDSSDNSDEELHNAKKEKGRSVNKASSGVSGTSDEELHSTKKEKGRSVNEASSGASGTGKKKVDSTKKELVLANEKSTPMKVRKASTPSRKANRSRKRVSDDESDSSDDFVIKSKKKVMRKASVKDEGVLEKESAKTPSKTVKVKKEELLESSEAPKKRKSPATKEPVAKRKKEEPEEVKWKWWEEEPHPNGIKWISLEHKGPYFPLMYEPIPDSVNFYYDGKKMRLSPKAEEVAGFYAKMLNHDYTKKDIFNENFFNDWKTYMTKEEANVIKVLSSCDFNEMHEYYTKLSEDRKALPKEEKKKIKEENDKLIEEYGFCVMDGHRQRVGNFKIEPPGLFRGRGDHPKQGKVKRRVNPEDVTINLSKGVTVPVPPYGRWKDVTHDNTVAWLACWVENISGLYKYVMLNPTARIKGQKDMEKFNIARKLHGLIQKIRDNYKADWKSDEMKIRQRAVALYFIDRLALRAGHEKEEGESADTVGCCSLRVEHIKLHKEREGEKFVVEFDFLGKDSVRYVNFVPVEKQVFINLQKMKADKSPGEDLFDLLSSNSLNKYLTVLMEGLTAKVFRTYNASATLQNQLKDLTKEDSSINEKILSYNRANRAVAILCNHQRAVPKTFTKTMENMQNKIQAKSEEISAVKSEIKVLKKEDKQKELEKKKNRLKTLEEQKLRMTLSMTDREENKEIALGTSKLNYLDPRISVAWCLRTGVPVEKIYNKTQREKFQWAIDIGDEDFIF